MGIGEMIGMRWVLWGDAGRARRRADPTASGTREVPPHVLDEMMRFIRGSPRPPRARSGRGATTHPRRRNLDGSERTARRRDRRRERHRRGVRSRTRGGRSVRRHRRPRADGRRSAWPASIGGEAWQVDLSDTAALADLTLEADILVNNAGIQHVSPIEDFDPARFSLILDLMLEAPFLLIRAALPGMYRAGFGRVVNISSVHGLRASPFKSAYVAAKHGLEGLSKVTAARGRAARGHAATASIPATCARPLVEKQIADQARVHGIPRIGGRREGHAHRVGDQAARRARRGRRASWLWLCGPSRAW